jgi:hypothetical protein
MDVTIAQEMSDRPEYMEMKPIYDVLDRALAERKK